MGNKDVAPFSSMLIIAFTFMLYYFSVFFLSLLFIPSGLKMQLLIYVSVIIFFSLIIWLYVLLVGKGKYKVILKRNEEYRGRKRLGAVLFPLIAFLLFNIGWILKMLQNQGKL